MKRFILLVLLIGGFLTTLGQNIDFDKYFSDRTLRIDYYRQGNSNGNNVILKRLVLKKGCWAGSKTQLIDPFINGNYRIVVKDKKSGIMLYSRCYKSLFQEYCETPEGKTSQAKYEEVMNIPLPKVAVEILLQQYDNQQFVTQQSIDYAPGMGVEVATKELPMRRLHYNGDPHQKVDIVIVPEGYGIADSAKMQNDMERFKDIVFMHDPFKSRSDDFNVWGVVVYGNESGITDPNKNIFVNSAVGASYNIFGIDRYLMTFQLFKLHDLLNGIPCDHIIIMANSDTYGGGAIYNFYAFSSLNEHAHFVLPHELGHSIGGLADEYVDEAVSFNDMHKKVEEPTQPNITSLVDFDSKWAAMLPEGTPIPTPAINVESGNGPLGVFEGAGYQSKGLYRPTMHCMMRDYRPFCPVCTKRLNEIFNLYTK